MTGRQLLEALASASLVVGCCGDPDWHDDLVRVERERFGAMIEACQIDGRGSDCTQLCREALEIADKYAVYECAVVDEEVDTALIEARYYVPTPDECASGRRPDGLVEPRARDRSFGAWLARIATLEAASVTEFVRLARRLERLAAPRSLIDAARRAIVDELVHARLTSRLARRFGGRVEAPVIADAPEPDRFALALANALEGQVLESHGAVVAAHVATTARDPEVRATFRAIARDELDHARLAHRLAPWLEAPLPAIDRARIAAARDAALARLA